MLPTKLPTIFEMINNLNWMTIYRYRHNCNFCLVWMMTNSLVLFIFNITFFHQHRSSSTGFIYSAEAFISSFWRSPTKAISSAYIKSLKLELWIIKSLTYSENNIGDITLSWGAPVLTIHLTDSWPLYHTLCVWSNIKSLIHRTRYLLTPIDSNKISTLILLNTDVKSRNMHLDFANDKLHSSS